MSETATDPGDGLTEFAEELKQLAETLLERVEPILRHTAEADGPEWTGCAWCPLCAAAALIRGERHEVVTALAEHGTAIVTVLREALAGVPVEPVMPHDHGTKNGGAHGDSPDSESAGESPVSEAAAPGTDPASGGAPPAGRTHRSGRARYTDIPVTIRT